MLNIHRLLAKQPEATESERRRSQKLFSFLLPFICIQTHTSKQTFVAFQAVSQLTHPRCTGCVGHSRDATKCFNLEPTMTLTACHRLETLPLTSLFSVLTRAKPKVEPALQVADLTKAPAGEVRVLRRRVSVTPVAQRQRFSH